MPARFNWAVPTILGNEDPPVLPTDVATKGYVDSVVGTGSAISNGNSSVEVIALDGNVNVAVDGNTVAVFNSDGANIIGNITADNLGNVSALSLNGNSTQLLYGNGEFANNFGNVSILSLDGNGSNVLRGNGFFSSVPTATQITSLDGVAKVETTESTNSHQVYISAGGLTRNFSFNADPLGSQLTFLPNQFSGALSIQAVTSAPGLNFCDGTVATIRGLFPYGPYGEVGNAAFPWNNMGTETLSVTNQATIGIANISTGNIQNLFTSNGNVILAAANISNLSAASGNVTLNSANITGNANVTGSLRTNRVFNNSILNQYSASEQTVASSSGVIVNWNTTYIYNNISDFGYISIGGQANGGVRNNGTDYLVVRVTGCITFNTNTNTNNSRWAQVLLGDQVVALAQSAIITPDTFCTVPFSVIVKMVPGQYISVLAQNNSSGNCTINGPVAGLIAGSSSKLELVLISRASS